SLSERRNVTKNRQPGQGPSHGCRRSKVAPASFQKPADRNHNGGPKTKRKQTCESPRHKKLHRGELHTTMSIKLVDYMSRGKVSIQAGFIGNALTHTEPLVRSGNPGCQN